MIAIIAKAGLLLAGIYVSLRVVVWFRKRWDRPAKRGGDGE